MGDTRRVRLPVLVGVLVALGVVLAGCSSNGSSGTESDSSALSTPEATGEIAVEEEIRRTWPVRIAGDELERVEVQVAPLSTEDRILALAVGSGEIADLLGAGGQLVGKDETSITVDDVPTVTSGHQIDVEQALALTPSVVLVDELTGPPEAISALRDTGAQIVEVPSVWTLADLPDRIEVIADAVGVDDVEADALSAALVPDPSTDSSSARVAFLYLRGPSAVYLLGGADTGADALIEAAGGIDVGSDLGYDGFVPLTAEALAQADPDVLLVMSDGLDSVGGIDGLLSLPGVAQTRAGESERVVVVDDQVLLSFGARTPSLVQRMREVFSEAVA